MMLRTISLLALAVCGVLCTAASASAAEPAPLFAGYWNAFYDHWAGVFRQQNGVVMGTLAIGALCLFIITRGKWRK